MGCEYGSLNRLLEFSLNGAEIQWIQRIQESDKSLKHELGSI